MRDIAGQINERIDEHDDKLDVICKEMTKQVDDLHSGNEELVAAREISGKRNKSVACWLFVVIALICILGGAFYAIFLM